MFNQSEDDRYTIHQLRVNQRSEQTEAAAGQKYTFTDTLAARWKHVLRVQNIKRILSLINLMDFSSSEGLLKPKVLSCSRPILIQMFPPDNAAHLCKHTSWPSTNRPRAHTHLQDMLESRPGYRGSCLVLARVVCLLNGCRQGEEGGRRADGTRVCVRSESVHVCVCAGAPDELAAASLFLGAQVRCPAPNNSAALLSLLS